MPVSAIFSVRVKNGREKDAALLLKQKIDYHKFNVHTVLVVDSIKGYIFVEGPKKPVEEAVREIGQFAGRIIGKVRLNELDEHLIPKPTIEEVNIGDIVEIIAGPLKGSKAKIKTMSLTREELNLDLLDSRISIPIVLHADNVRKLQVTQDED